MKSSAEFDIVLYGATGVCGRLVAEYLAGQYGIGGSLTWALAGRNLEKLRAVRDELRMPSDIPILVADGADTAALDTLVQRTRMVVTTVGPYQLHGAPLLASCARSGTDYLDLCGEPAWMRQMIEFHEGNARATGARILFSCGFDSVPFELGVWFLQQSARQHFGAPVRRVKGRVRALKGSISAGTVASLKATMAAAVCDPELFALLRTPFSMTPGFTGPEQPSASAVAFDPDLGAWTAPFMMSGVNTRNIHRSNFLMGHPYGTDFVYDEMVLGRPGDSREELKQMMAREQSAIGTDREATTGPGLSSDARQSGYYDLLFAGFSDHGRQIRVSVHGDRDPGYGSTSKILAETAMVLLRGGAHVPGGIWTPAAALDRLLLDGLTARAGVTLRVENVLQVPS